MLRGLLAAGSTLATPQRAPWGRCAQRAARRYGRPLRLECRSAATSSPHRCVLSHSLRETCLSEMNTSARQEPSAHAPTYIVRWSKEFLAQSVPPAVVSMPSRRSSAEECRRGGRCCAAAALGRGVARSLAGSAERSVAWCRWCTQRPRAVHARGPQVIASTSSQPRLCTESTPSRPRSVPELIPDWP